MSNKQDHFIQMNMAIEEMAPEEYWMYFTPARPEKGEFYAVTAGARTSKDSSTTSRKPSGIPNSGKNSWQGNSVRNSWIRTGDPLIFRRLNDCHFIFV